MTYGQTHRTSNSGAPDLVTALSPCHAAGWITWYGRAERQLTVATPKGNQGGRQPVAIILHESGCVLDPPPPLAACRRITARNT
jgi:hypothetical protein